MDWKTAVESMLYKDKAVRRKINRHKKVLRNGRIEDSSGAIKLAYAWTHDEQAVRVFIDVDTGHFIVPDVEDMIAKDWEIVNEGKGSSTQRVESDPQTF